jgi:CheY-like chemotaxis protein
VETVRNGRDAIRALSPEPPDLVITDIMMPHASGLDILDALRGHAETRETPVILISAAAEPRIRDKNVRFIPKPFNIQSVLDAVAAFLQPRPLHRSRMTTLCDQPISRTSCASFSLPMYAA